MTSAAAAIANLTEKDWTAQLIGTRARPGLARQLGWTMAYHVLRSRGSEPGFPDWVLIRERVILLELKTENGKLTVAQQDWMRALLNAGAEAYIVRPRDLPDIGRVLARYGRLDAVTGPARDSQLALLERTRRECG